MSGTPQVGMAEFSRRAKIGMAIGVAVLAAGFVTPFVLAVADTVRDNRLTAQAESRAQFQVGDIVQSRIAKFRGIVVGRYCAPNGCDYEVRFDGASMQPQEMGEYELQAWRG